MLREIIGRLREDYTISDPRSRTLVAHGTFQVRGSKVPWFYYMDGVADDWLKKKGCTHTVFLYRSPGEGSGYRGAVVKKTVARVVVDEDADGNPVWKTWRIFNHNRLAKPMKMRKNPHGGWNEA